MNFFPSKTNLRGKRITVMGLGISGQAACRFLSDKGASVLVVDDGASAELTAKSKEFERMGIPVWFGDYDFERALEADLMLSSPGIPLDHVLLREAKRRGTPVMIEVELAAQLCGNEIVAVTGTNGKSTVTSMMAHVLSENGFPAIVCGNIGKPVIGVLSEINENTILVIETSSFQLARMHGFRPHVGVLLNIRPDHIDWHGSFDAYAAAKWSIFRHQKSEDFAVINSELQIQLNSAVIKEKVPSKICLFQSRSGVNPNISACLEAARIYGIGEAAAMDSIGRFKPLEHRMEVVIKNNKFTIVNDSKATNVDSLTWALHQTHPPIVLIAGGRSKDAPFDSVATLIEEKVSSLIVMGETKARLLDAWGGVRRKFPVGSLKEAVARALEEVPPGGTILFSPACKSFDMFVNYEERGRMFKKYARELAGEGAYV